MPELALADVTVPAAFHDKRRCVEAMRGDLDRCKPLLAAWQAAIDALRAAGSLMAASPDAAAQSMGFAVCARPAGAEMRAALDSCRATLAAKLALLDDIGRKCRDLDKRSAALQKQVRRGKQSEPTAARAVLLLRRARAATEGSAEDAHWAFAELLCETESEMDFARSEAMRGISRQEHAFLCRFAAAALVGCAQQQGAAAGGPGMTLAEAAASLQEYAATFAARKRQFVASKKQERVARALAPQGVCALPRVVRTRVLAPDSAVSAASATSAASAPCIAGTAAATAPGPALYAARTCDAPRVRVPEAPVALDRPRSSATTAEPASPASAPADLDSVASSSSSSSERESSEHESNPAAPPVPPKPRATGLVVPAVSAQRPRPVSVNAARGFMIGEHDGWREYVDRSTGESFFVHAASGQTSPTGPATNDSAHADADCL